MEVPPIFSTEILEELTSDMDKLRGAKVIGRPGGCSAPEVAAENPLFSTTFVRAL